jgi:6-methylsalicylate decarboxylase
MSNDKTTRDSAEQHSPPTLGRRGILHAMMARATLTAASTALGSLGCADNVDSNDDDGRTKRVDTHHHAFPPEMKEWMVAQHMLPPNINQPWTNWDEGTALDVMNRLGIQAGVVSMPAPSDVFVDESAPDGGLSLARSGVRILNDSLADMARRHPTRFGFYAYVPLAHVDFALEEIARSADQLGADGFLLMNHIHNRYLGDPSFEPLFAELNRRRAVIMTHPDSLPSEADGGSKISPNIPTQIADFMLDTTRGALGMMWSNTLDRYPDITIILPHGGGFLPYIVERISRGYFRGEGLDPEKVRGYVRRFYYDTAGPMSLHMTPPLLATTDPNHLLYGSDYHQVPEDIVQEDLARFLSDPALDASARAAICRDNALKLFPRLARRL